MKETRNGKMNNYEYPARANQSVRGFDFFEVCSKGTAKIIGHQKGRTVIDSWFQYYDDKCNVESIS